MSTTAQDVLVAGIIGAILFVQAGCLKKNEPHAIEYDRYGCILIGRSADGSPSSRSAAVVCYSLEKKLVLCTARHSVMSDGKDRKYSVQFSSGVVRDIVPLPLPPAGVDCAFVAVDSAGLVAGRDYAIPRFVEPDFMDEGKSTYIFEDYYGDRPKKVISVNKSGEARSCYLDGPIQIGRSGSPVFIRDTVDCIGIVSGFYPVSATNGARTKVVSVLSAANWATEELRRSGGTR